MRGCFCEKLSLYAGIEHATVVYAQPAKTLRLQRRARAAAGIRRQRRMTWQIEPAGGGSRITLTYNVGGFADRPLADWAPIVDEVLGGQLQRLARYVTVRQSRTAEGRKTARRRPELPNCVQAFPLRTRHGVPRMRIRMLVHRSVAALLATACQTVQTTQPGAVGVDRKQMMLVSEQEIEKGARWRTTRSCSKAARKRRAQHRQADVRARAERSRAG